jgi:predicted metal-binding membrane protein
MSGMPMPGGWTMSMTWMRMPGQTWPGAAASFLGMWVVMMVAMMLPSLVPMLRRYRQVVGRMGDTRLDDTRLGRLTLLVALAYFFYWSVFGIAAFLMGAGLAALEMQLPALARAVPFAVSAVLVMAGLLQFTPWKARQLDCCREPLRSGCALEADPGTAWRTGLRFGLRCSRCCAGLTASVLVMGIMDWRVMAVVTAATSAERLAPAGKQVARVIGAAAVGTGLLLLARSAGLG